MNTPVITPNRAKRHKSAEALLLSGAGARLAWLALPLGALSAALATHLAPGGALVSVGLFALLACVIAYLMRAHYPHTRLGSANAVTLLRAALVCALVAPLAAEVFAPAPIPSQARWLITAIATLALVLDGLDGWLARRSGLSSSFGARFDMEVDAALGLILALSVAIAGTVGVWVLALGAMRYAYVLAGFALPWLNAPLPERFRRKLICVVQIGTLIVLTVPGLGALPATLLAASATLALGGSFAADIIWLARRRAT